ncbi:hypothetical protein L6164_030203 [Bauhinia variegata]|uniref:Uncharacterized protein n=1 Tax=Bauhinia variegata TaxID=167791 RepID=A0ACB9LBZ8_BAUVA|nr:hypothetical protein L6164_030203 [Bauhinia variegata]
MGIPDPENVMTVKRVIRELVQGQESATQLKGLVQKQSGVDGSLSAEELVAKILRSFTESLSVLTATGVEVSQNFPAVSGENGSQKVGSCNDRGFEYSGESRKRSSPETTKDRRGCYKRRRNAQVWTTVSSKPDDRYAWRKYGQKEILNSKFPRSYFRCTRKHDQGCRALKQVQRIQESPEMYQATYIGIHTCRNTVKAQQLVLGSSPDHWESFLVNQPEPDPSKVTYEEDQNPFSSLTPIIKEETIPIIKEEYPKEETPSDVTDNMDPSIWSELKDIEPAVMPSSKMASDNHSHSTDMEMDFSVDSVFGTDRDRFHFDDNQFI